MGFGCLDSMDNNLNTSQMQKDYINYVDIENSLELLQTAELEAVPDDQLILSNPESNSSSSLDDGQIEFLAGLGLNRKNGNFSTHPKRSNDPGKLDTIDDKIASTIATSNVKRPGNAFILFSRERRKEVVRLYPNLDNRQVYKMLGLMWRKLTPDEKKPFIDQFEAELRVIRQDHPGWNYAKSRAKSTRETADKNTEVLDHRLRSRTQSTRVYYDSKQGFRKGVKQDNAGPYQRVFSPYQKSRHSPIRPDPKEHGVVSRPNLDKTRLQKHIPSQIPGQLQLGPEQDQSPCHDNLACEEPKRVYQLSEVRVIQTDGKNQVVGIYKAIY